MTRLLVLGAGAVGTAAAALAVRRGHAVTLWSPRGGGTHGIGAGLRVSGMLTGRAQVGIAVDVGRALRGAEAALLAVPPAALGVVIRRIAPMLPPGLPVLLMPSQSLAPLLLARLTEGRNPVAALGAPPFEARRVAPDEIALTALAAEADLASVPAAAAPALAALAADLLGVPVRPCPGLMAVLLGRADNVRMASLALLSLTRIERDVRVDTVDNVERTGAGWQVSGTLFNGTAFQCWIGNNGQIDGVDYNGSVSGAPSQSYLGREEPQARPDSVPYLGREEAQWSDQRYADARAALGRTAPAAAPSTDRLPAYPGGPIPGEVIPETIDGEI
jgi:hypothetical protein